METPGTSLAASIIQPNRATNLKVVCTNAPLILSQLFELKWYDASEVVVSAWFECLALN